MIVIPLVGLFGLSSKSLSPSLVNWLQVLLGIMILAYSQLLGMSDFSARAVKLHACGIELGAIAKKLYTYVFKDDQKDEKYDEKFNSFIKEYYQVLSNYENHKYPDLLGAKFDNLSNVIDSKRNVKTFMFMKVVLLIRRVYREIFYLCHYAISIGVAIAFLWLYVDVELNTNDKTATVFQNKEITKHNK